MSVSPTSKTLNIGETVQLTGTKNPSTTSERTQWTSSNTSVATVSNLGFVTAKSAGTTTITFKNSSSTKSDSCTVKVINGIKASDIAKKQNKLGFYGEQVTNYKCSNTKGVTVWRIFYADTENIYLIADDCRSCGRGVRRPKSAGISLSVWQGKAPPCASAIRQAPTKRVKPPLHRKAPTVTVPTYEEWRFFRPATPVPTPLGDTPENRSASRSRVQRRYPRQS